MGGASLTDELGFEREIPQTVPVLLTARITVLSVVNLLNLTRFEFAVIVS